jgi:hypothetical protein
MELLSLRGVSNPVRDICTELGFDLLERQDPGRCCRRGLHRSVLVSHQSAYRHEHELMVPSCINAFVVKWYGEAEFWLALGKVFLILIVYSFTFITMVGGNPKHDAYGVRTMLRA